MGSMRVSKDLAEEFDLLAEVARFVDAVREGLEDSEAGRVVRDDELDLDDAPPQR
jgi:predicted transcriptional regulator